MATDAPAAPDREETAPPYGVRLLITVFLLALYQFGHRVPLPLVNMGAVLEFLRAAQPAAPPSAVKFASILTLDLMPLATGFILVELFSLMTSSGRRLRGSGAAGRRRLNRAALATALALSAVQALGIGVYLSSRTAPSGAGLVTAPGWTFQLLTIVTLTATTGALFVLGNLISEYGIGNGFALLIVHSWFLGVLGLMAVLDVKVLGDSTANRVGLVGMAILVGLIIRYFRWARGTQAPAFPQSLLPLHLSGLIIAWALLPVLPYGPERTLPPWLYPAATLVLVPLLCWLVFPLFSGRRCLESSLPETDEVLDRVQETLKRRLVPSTLLLTLGVVAVLAWSSYQTMTFAAGVDFLHLVIAVAVGFDLWDQFVFLRRSRSTVRLVQLDDVHYAYRLVERLREQGIEPLARALHVRSLYFFLGALIKVDVLVPPGELGRAREVLTELEMAREIKAF